jgi:hypothetical protein
MDFHARVVRETTRKLKCIQADNDGEYMTIPKTAGNMISSWRRQFLRLHNRMRWLRE